MRAPRGGERAAESFLLPGESLSKYGGPPAESAQKAAPEVQAPARPASTFKPSTLIEAPISVGWQRPAGGRIDFAAPQPADGARRAGVG